MKDGGSIVSIVLERQKREDNEIPAHFIHDIKTKGYEAIGVNAFLRKLMRFLRKKGVKHLYYFATMLT